MSAPAPPSPFEGQDGDGEGVALGKPDGGFARAWHTRDPQSPSAEKLGREGRQWYVVLAGDEVPAEPLPATGAVTGIDMGIAHFLTTARGEHTPNPRHGRRTADALADAQRAVTAFPRCKRDNRTARHRRAVEKVAALHRTGAPPAVRITRARPPWR